MTMMKSRTMLEVPER
jgi:hypothetical protein